MADNSIVKQSKDIYALKRFLSTQKMDIDVFAQATHFALYFLIRLFSAIG